MYTFIIITLSNGTDRPSQTVKPQIRNCRMWHLIRVYPICHTYSNILDTLRCCRMDFQIFTKTYLYNFDPLKPHFYKVKLGFAGVYIIFLVSAQNTDCGYSLELPHRGSSNEYQQSMFWAEIWKIPEFLSENFSVFGGEIFNIFE